MVKATNIKANQSKPIVNNIGTTPQSNMQPVSTNNNTGSTWNVDTTPLWKKAINAIPSYSKEDIAKAAKTAKTPTWVLNNLTPEVKPQNAVEETAWGWNYGLDRDYTQTDNQQWHYNALVGSGHVVWLPEWQTEGVKYWNSWEQGKVMPTRVWILPKEEAATTETPTTVTPTATTSGTKKITTSNQTTQVQAQPQTQERIVTPDEFWISWGAKSIEEAEQTIAANEEAIAAMEADLNKSTTGELYGKVTADKSQPVKTLEDANSVYKSMNEARIASFKQLQTMDNGSIAAAIVWGVMATDSQQMRDLMQYDPAKYNEVQNQVKALRWQMNINAISSWSGDYNTVATNWSSSLANEKANFATNNSNWITSTADILKSVYSSLSSNVSASTAQEQMWNIENDMARLQNRLKNLKKEANTVFKWDVPQYIVNAYIANRTAEIQDQLSILENRYNAAYSRYQTEWEQTKWAAEFELKKEELAIKKQNAYYDNWATQQGVLQWWAELSWTANNVTTTSLSREEISTSIDDLVTACQNWQLWNAQCAAGIQQYYFPTLWVNLGSLSAYSAKQWICNELAWDYTPQKWDVVVMSSSSAPENWHMWIVVGVDWDTLTYLDWNGSVENGVWTEKAAIRTTKLSNASIYGYYNPTKWNTWDTWDGYFNPNYAEIYGNFLRWKYSAWKQLETTAASLWLTIEQLRNQANAWKNSQNNNVDVQERLDALEYLLRDSDLRRWQRQAASSNTWMWEIDRFLFSEAWDFNSSYKFIKDNITFDKLLELKRWGATFWALSDNELKAIWNSATRLHTSMDKDTWEKTLLSIYNGLRKWIGEDELTLEQVRSMNTGTWWDAFNNPTYSSSAQYTATDILSI